MPLTYVEAVRELQQRGIDTLKVAQAVQLSTLRAAYDITIPGPAVPAARKVSDWALALGYQLMEQQVAYAKRLVDAFAQPARATDSGAPTVAVDALAALSAVNQLATQAGLDSSAAPAQFETAVVEVPGAASASPLVTEPPAILMPPFVEAGPRELVNEQLVPVVSTDDAGVKVVTEPYAHIELADESAPSFKPRKVPAVSNNRMPPKRAPKNSPKTSG